MPAGMLWLWGRKHIFQSIRSVCSEVLSMQISKQSRIDDNDELWLETWPRYKYLHSLLKRRFKLFVEEISFSLCLLRDIECFPWSWNIARLNEFAASERCWLECNNCEWVAVSQILGDNERTGDSRNRLNYLNYRCSMQSQWTSENIDYSWHLLS